MNIQKFTLGISLILCSVFFSGCAQSNARATTEASEMPIQFVSSSTPKPSITTMPPASPTLMLTPTPIPILSAEDAQARLLDLMANNGACQLSCLWGITPGKSLVQEAKAILLPLSRLSNSVHLDSADSGSIMPRYSENDLEIYTRVAFLANSDNSIVNRVSFNTEAHKLLLEGGYEDVFDSTFFSEKVSAYSLPHVLNEQGVPSSVMIATFGRALTRGGTGGFDILLLYPEQGILANYTTQMHLIGANVRGCPSNAHVEMELFPSGQADTFLERLQETDWSVKLSYYKHLEEVTSISVEEFYKTFHEPTNKCIETPAKLWPIPEP